MFASKRLFTKSAVMGPGWGPLQSYAFAIAAVLVATALRYGLEAWIKPPYLMAYPAVFIAAAVGGFGPGFVATALAVVLVHALFVDEAMRFTVQQGSYLISSIAFLVMGIGVSAIAGFLQRRQARERRRSARALIESGRRLNYALAATGAGMWDWDIAKGSVKHNRLWCQLLGLDSNYLEHPIEAFADLIHEDDRAAVTERLGICLRGEGPYVSEHRLRRSDGQFIWVHDRGDVVQREPGGRAVRMIGGCADITERRRAEHALAISEERLSLAVDVARLGLFDHNLVTDELYASPFLRGLMDLAEDEPFSLERVLDKVHEDDRAAFVASVARNNAPGSGELRHIEHRIVRRDGTVRWLSVAIRPQHGGTGSDRRPLRVVGAVADITERKAAELANARLASIVQSSQDAIMSVTPDGRIASWNEGAERLFGYTATEAIGGPAGLLVPPGHADGPNGIFDRVIASERLAIETVRRRKDGTLLNIFLSAAPIHDENGALTGLSAIMHDITERKRDEARLRQAAIVFTSSQEGVVITDPSSRIVAVNPAFSAITGYSETEAVGQSMRLLQSGRHGPDFYQELWRTMEEEGCWQGEIWNRRKDGQVYPQLLNISPVRNDDGTLVNYVGTFNDISSMKQWESRLDHLAHHDGLTDLPNRILLLSTLELSIARAKRHRTAGAVLFLDLDRFKNVNDSLGHGAGDDLLIKVANRIRENLRASDMVARFGGDEFAVLLENLADPGEAHRIAQALIDRLEQPFRLESGPEVYVSASIGISLFPNDSEAADTLIQHADAALYMAKEGGRGTYRYYDAALTLAAHSRLETEARMRRALERNEFVLHYQPLISLADGRVTGVEAPVRWHTPEQELVMPRQFIDLAEETGFIIPLGEWILHAACAQMKAWQDRGIDLGVLAVNLSPRQFRQANLHNQLAKVLSDTGLPGHCLELEITEGTLMEEGRDAAAKLAAIKELGVRLAIDDFGTGYSSLAYLRRFPIDKLKVDQGFICDLPGDQAAKEIAAAVIALGRTLNLEVLAEGVETEAQLAFLERQKCDTAQGYLFGRPLPAKTLEAWYAQRVPRRLKRA